MQCCQKQIWLLTQFTKVTQGARCRVRRFPTYSLVLAIKVASEPQGRGEDKRFVVLFTSGEDKDWPDHLDLNTGRFLYYGDNKKPGHELHATQRKGNEILRHVFDLLHGNPPQRCRIPPFLVFRKYRTNASTRSVQYRGLAVPGFEGLPATEDLIAIWKTSDGQRFQNYRAIFTILDVPKISRAWINDLKKQYV